MSNPSTTPDDGQTPGTSAITLRPPQKYGSSSPSATTFTSPPLEWLEGTWAVTHSTLPMWRKAKNVRITYKIITPPDPSKPTLLDDEVCSEPTERTLMPQPKSIKGIDTPAGVGAWDWRGKGLLKIASSHWEVLGWGERDAVTEERERIKERWVVTWFAPSLFTPAGVDLYSNRMAGMTEGTYEAIMMALENIGVKELVDLVKNEMKKVKID
ncbi:hypothetical protein F5884DRAFT_496581 [Xylogone sp. PMI_703]|nr:hypothetical protein F5884DRAFT_496581 [Xylogone sp. PMI_703]